MFLGFAMSRFVPTIGISFGMRKQEIAASALPSQAANFRIKNVTDSANRRIRIWTGIIQSGVSTERIFWRKKR